jgi:hypothetical protein
MAQPLTVADLHRDREARAAVNHETYKRLWEGVQDRIRARAENKGTDLTWQVPPFVPGRPVYAVSHAARYVADKLRRGGFVVSVAAPQPDVHVLFVSWPAAARPPRPRPRPQPPPPHPTARQPPPTVGVNAVGLEEASRTLEKLKAKLRVGR